MTPRSNTEGTETESSNPFVKLEFTSEAGEYRVGEYKDSHKTGSNVMDDHAERRRRQARTWRA